MERKAENMQKAIIEELNVIMDENENVVVVNADLGLLFKDGKDASHHPERVFDCGIAEPSMIGTAAGLALSGKIPYTTTIAEMAVTRVLENIRLDAAYQHLNMTMFGQGRGVAYGVGGSTHVMVEDISMLRAIPGLTIIFPADAYALPVFADIQLCVGDVLVLEKDLSPIGHLQPVQAAQKRGLSAAAGADDGHNLAPADLGGDPLEDLQLAKIFSQILCP